MKNPTRRGIARAWLYLHRERGRARTIGFSSILKDIPGKRTARAGLEITGRGGNSCSGRLWFHSLPDHSGRLHGCHRFRRGTRSDLPRGPGPGTICLRSRPGRVCAIPLDSKPFSLVTSTRKPSPTNGSIRIRAWISFKRPSPRLPKPRRRPTKIPRRPSTRSRLVVLARQEPQIISAQAPRVSPPRLVRPG